MHGATFTRAQTALFPIDLGHHPVHIASLGETMPMASVSTSDLVALVEIHAEAGRDRFFTSVEMYEPRYLASGEFDVNPLLELPDDLHGPVCPQ